MPDLLTGSFCYPVYAAFRSDTNSADPEWGIESGGRAASTGEVGVMETPEWLLRQIPQCNVSHITLDSLTMDGQVRILRHLRGDS